MCARRPTRRATPATINPIVSMLAIWVQRCRHYSLLTAERGILAMFFLANVASSEGPLRMAPWSS